MQNSTKQTVRAIALEQPNNYSETNLLNEEQDNNFDNFKKLPKVWIPIYYITLLFMIVGVVAAICIFEVDLSQIQFNIYGYANAQNGFTELCANGCEGVNDTFLNDLNSQMISNYYTYYDSLEYQIYRVIRGMEPITKKSCNVSEAEVKELTIVTASKNQPELVTSPLITISCGKSKEVKGIYNFNYNSRIGSFKPKGGARIYCKDYVTEKEDKPYAITVLVLLMIPLIMFSIAIFCVTFRLRKTSNYNVHRTESCCFWGKNDLAGHVHRLINAVIAFQVIIIFIMPFVYIFTGSALSNGRIYEKYQGSVDITPQQLFLVIFIYVCQFVVLIGVCIIHFLKLW